MGIVITGASGFVGRYVVPVLAEFGDDLLLVGRSKESLQELFPDIAVTDYDNLEVAAKNQSTLVHLAVRNNNKPGDIQKFREANVEHLKAVIRSAKTAGIKTFVYATTLQTSEKRISSPYAQSKREAEEILARTNDITIVILRLPTVYAKTYAGKLQLLEKVPTFMRPTAFKMLASLKPTVHADLVATAIQNTKNSQKNIDFIVSDRQEGNRFYGAVKRIVDLSFALFVIIFLWWVLVIAWLAVKFSSPGPAIFAQQRIGKRGRLFTCYKLRTMRAGTKQVGTHEVASNNITKVGRFLRKTKIDELPQIWNIFKNELSLVGPRPCLPVQEELIAERKKRGVLDIKGGITGWAQIQGVDMSDPRRLAKLDAEYINLRSIVLDTKIIFATLIGRGQGDKIRR